VFQGQLRDQLIQGVGLLEDDDQGLIKTITVMIRPRLEPTASRSAATSAQRATR
jgi:hypothetical protein